MDLIEFLKKYIFGRWKGKKFAPPKWTINYPTTTAVAYAAATTVTAAAFLFNLPSSLVDMEWFFISKTARKIQQKMYNKKKTKWEKKWKNCTREKCWKCDFVLLLLQSYLCKNHSFFFFSLRFSFWDLICKEISNSTFSIIFSCKKWGNWKLQ